MMSLSIRGEKEERRRRNEGRLRDQHSQTLDQHSQTLDRPRSLAGTTHHLADAAATASDEYDLVLDVEES